MELQCFCRASDIVVKTSMYGLNETMEYKAWKKHIEWDSKYNIYSTGSNWLTRIWSHDILYLDVVPEPIAITDYAGTIFN